MSFTRRLTLAFCSLALFPAQLMAQEAAPATEAAAEAAAAPMTLETAAVADGAAVSTDTSADTSAPAPMTLENAASSEGMVADANVAEGNDAVVDENAENNDAVADENAEAYADNTTDYAYDGTSAENIYGDEEEFDDDDDYSSISVKRDDKALYQAELGVGIVLLAAGVGGLATSIYYTATYDDDTWREPTEDNPSTITYDPNEYSKNTKYKKWLPEFFVLPSAMVAIAGGVMTGLGAKKLMKWNDKYGNKVEAEVSASLTSASFQIRF